MKKLTIKAKARQMHKQKKKFNLYQKIDDAIKLKNKSGIFEAPTGVGKGEIISAKVRLKFKSKSKYITIQIIVAHRILLAMQLTKRIVEMQLQKLKAKFVRLAVHSGNPMEYGVDAPLDKMYIGDYPDKRARGHKQIENEINNAINLGQDMLISITYHSLPSLVTALKNLKLDSNIQIGAYGDEIHRLSNETWYNTMKDLKPFCNAGLYGFSATIGKMRDKLVKLFGKVIWYMSPAEAIRTGLIVKPVHGVHMVQGNHENFLDQGIEQTFEYYEKKLKIPQKMVVHCTRSWEIGVVEDPKNKVKQLQTKYDDLMVASVSSQYGHIIDGVVYKDRMLWVETIKKHQGKLIVAHIDIINSGIDVPGFNVSLWTKPPKSEVRQTQGDGRSRRLSQEDRSKLEKQIINTLDRSTWEKPYSYCSCLAFAETEEQDVDRFTDLVVASREDGFDPEDVICDSTGSRKGSGDDEDPDIPFQSKVKTQIKHKLENIKKKEKKEAELLELDKWRNCGDLTEKLKKINEAFN